MKKVVIISGPTCSGKTALALALKQIFPFSLINGDAVQVYQELNIGADKISAAINKKYPHYLLNECSLAANYTVFDYQTKIRTYLNELPNPLIVGGSGFYIKAATYDYQFVKEHHDPHDVDAILQKGLGFAKDYLLARDPHLAIDFTNERKVKRALISILNGVLPSQNKHEDTPIYQNLIIYLDMPREILREKIIARIKAQLKRGFREEVTNLMFYQEKLKNILGYREMLFLIKGQITEEEYITLVTNKTMQLAKKQKTWFCNKMPVTIFDATSPNLLAAVSATIKEFLNG